MCLKIPHFPHSGESETCDVKRIHGNLNDTRDSKIKIFPNLNKFLSF